MNMTFAMIKPDAIESKNTGNIISMIELNGFKILSPSSTPKSLLTTDVSAE